MKQDIYKGIRRKVLFRWEEFAMTDVVENKDLSR